jgi:hypothetical protein
MRPVAALFVDPAGIYSTMPGVDCWGPERDARLYDGPHPVVAHPPCSRWCRLAGLVEARWGHKRGDDGGCFKAALEAVRTYGGILEHPAYSDAWRAFDLNRPPTGGGWVMADFNGGWTCYVEQARYGHVAKKATWLYACGVTPPTLRWGHVPDRDVKANVSWCGNRTWAHADRPRVGKKVAAATPIEFAEALLAIARSGGCSRFAREATR